MLKMKGVILCCVILIHTIGHSSAGFLECTQNTDCGAPTATCIDNICECPVGSVFNSQGTTCLPVVTGIESSCIDDQQCGQLLGENICNEGKCECAKGWRYHTGRCIKTASLNEACTNDNQCIGQYDLLAMGCKEGTCQCNAGYYLRGDYDCRPISTELEDYCSLNSDCKIANSVCIASRCKSITATRDIFSIFHPKKPNQNKVVQQLAHRIDCNKPEDCSAIENSLCYTLTKKCICKRGYFLTENDGCIPELGVDAGCSIDEDCKIAPGRCIDGKCYCRKTYFSSKGNNACQKPMTHDNLFCNTKERCYVLGTEVTCLNNKCRCTTTAEMDVNFVCREHEGVVSSGCNNDKECTAITNSVCVDTQCQCPENYRLEGTKCLPNIGATCDEHKKLCMIEKTVCGPHNKCICQPQYVPNGVLSCLKESMGLGTTCEIDQQCSQKVENSVCHNTTCICRDDYIVYQSMCHKKKFMGDVCTSSAECHVLMESNVLCRNSKCQCSADMQPTKNSLDCEKSGSVSSVLLRYGNFALLWACYLGYRFSM